MQAVEEEVVERDIKIEDEHRDNSSSNITDEVVEQSENIFSGSSALSKDSTEMGDSEELPLPKLSSTDRDEKELLAQQKQDSSLENVRKWAETGEFQYDYNEGVLKQAIEGEGENDFIQIVVPIETTLEA